MWPYWFLYLLPALLALGELRQKTLISDKSILCNVTGVWLLICLLYAFMVGWRFQVGGDWFPYIDLLYLAKYASRYPEWWLDDPGFRFLEWLTVQFEWSVFSLNLIAGLIFSFALVIFCTNLPRPWLAFSVAVPYVVIILGMGYTRQGIALGLLMIAFVALRKKSVRGFLFYAVLGAMFHKSAVLVIPMAALANSHNRVLTLTLVGLVALLSYFLFLEASVEKLTSGYLEAQYQSEGALIRLSMNLIPAVLLIWKRKEFLNVYENGGVWIWISWVAFVLFGAYFVSPSSTTVDRIALYVLPLQLVAFSCLPDMLSKVESQKRNIVFLILVYYAAVEFVWLNFAVTAFAWLPYRFYLFEVF